MAIDQFGIHLGPVLYLRFYGLILVTGAFCGGYLAALNAQRKGINPDLIWDGMLWALIGGIAGARLWHILTPPPSMVQAGLTTAYYLDLTHTTSVSVPFVNWTFPIPLAFAVWQGGLGIPGAVLGGLVTVYFYVRSLKGNFAEWADLVAPALALGQFIGRWGNYVNQELYGRPTTLPWGITIDAFPGQKFHPTFLYESIGSLLICLALLYIGRRYAERLKQGDLFLIYLLLYPALRFFLEFIRLDSSQVMKMNANQTVMAVVFVFALGWLTTRHRRLRRYQQMPAAEAEPSAPAE